MLKSKYTYIIIALLLPFTACVDDEKAIVPDTTQDVTILLDLSDMYSPSTKAETSEENTIADLRVLLFDESDALFYETTASLVSSQQGASKEISANLPATGRPVTMMVLANIGDKTFGLTESKSDILKRLTFDVPAVDEEVTVPMWGETFLPTGLYTDSDPIRINMIRSMACVQVYVDTKQVLNFTLEKVYLVGVYDQGYVAPIDEAGNVQKNVLSVPAGAHSLPRLLQHALMREVDNSGTSFFVPESALSSIGQEGEKIRNFCLIIGGTTTIDGESRSDCYYRLDFLLKNAENADENYEMDIRRNTKYIFAIEAIHEYGVSAEAALSKTIPDNASRKNIELSTMIVGDGEEDCTDKGLNDVTTDGMYYLAVNSAILTGSVNNYSGDKQGWGFAKIQVYTNSPEGWRMIDMPEGIFSNQKEGRPNTFYETWVWLDPSKVNLDNAQLFYIKAGSVWKAITVSISR